MYRALKTERPDALFHDPLTRRLAGYEGLFAVEGGATARHKCHHRADD